MNWPTYAVYSNVGVAWLDEYPADWASKPLKLLATMRNGDSITSEAIEESGDYPVYGGNGLRGYAGTYTHQGNRVLIGRQGALCGNIHLVSGKYWASEHAIVTTPERTVSPRWLAYVLRVMNLGQYSQAAAQPGIAADVIGKLRVPTPSSSEQEGIADFLDRETAKIDALIAKQQQLIATLREDRQAQLISLVAHGCDSTTAFKPCRLGWVGDVPRRWDVLNIRRVAEMKTGHTPSRTVAEYWENTTIPWFTLADVWQLRDGQRMYLGETKDQISELGLANSAAELLPTGTVVLSRTASVGFSGIMPTPMATSQDFWNWVCGPRIVPEYLLYIFRAMQGYFSALMMGSTHKTIYQADAAGIRIPLPPLPEQREIVQQVGSRTAKVDQLIEKAREVVETLREYRSALITDAVTGKIDVRGAA